MSKKPMKFIGRGLIDLDEEKRSLGKVFLIEERCKGCNLCVEFCPKGVLHESATFNKKGYHPPELIEIAGEKECVACGYCTLICPEFAIYIEMEDNDKEAE